MKLQILPRLQAYLGPLAFLAVAAYGGLLVFFEILTLQSSAKDTFSKSKLSERIFGKLWLRIDRIIAAREVDTALPNLVAQAHGTVLELGPGSGNQLPRYDVSKITRVYGIEPNTAFHDALRKKIKENGLGDVYTIVPCGVEDTATLKEYGIESGSIDTIVSVQVLCSVPRPREVVRRLYGLLRPGGAMIVYEHVQSEDAVSGVVQRVYNVVWPLAMGGCQLDRPTGRYLLEAGSWATVQLEMPKREEGWLVLPHVSGRLMKRGK